jgi:hypothetical protein
VCRKIIGALTISETYGKIDIELKSGIIFFAGGACILMPGINQALLGLEFF